MKSAAIALTAIATLAAACASPPEGKVSKAELAPAPQTSPGPGSAGTSGSLGMGTPAPGGDLMGGSMVRTPGTGLANMDVLALCDLNRLILQAESEGQRQAMLERLLPNMSPQMREQQAQMMRQRCDGRRASAQ